MTSSWDNDGLICLSSSSPPPPASGSYYITPSSSMSDVVVLTDTEDDDAPKRPDPPPVRRVLTDAQLNLPGPSAPAVPADPFAVYSTRILEIIPDVEPAHLRTLLEQHYLASGADVVENVLHALFEDASYPRVEKVANKRKRAPDDDDGREKARVKVDYASKERAFSGGPHYYDLALSQLQEDFPWIPKQHIRTTLGKNGKLYAPTRCVSPGILQLT
jgi:E3 ubiquitin-protein ligase RNF216